MKSEWGWVTQSEGDKRMLRVCACTHVCACSGRDWGPKTLPSALWLSDERYYLEWLVDGTHLAVLHEPGNPAPRSLAPCPDLHYRCLPLPCWLCPQSWDPTTGSWAQGSRTNPWNSSRRISWASWSTEAEAASTWLSSFPMRTIWVTAGKGCLEP